MQDAHLQRLHAQLLRERPEPSEGFAPIPLFLVFFFCIVFFWAGVYMVENSGDYSAWVYVPGESVAEEDAGPVEPPSPMEIGRIVYNANCVACHQASGLGVPGAFPPLVDSEWVRGDPKRSTAIVIAGLNGQIEVKGNTYNGVMTPFGQLSDREIAGVISYIRADPKFENGADQITEDLVAEVRGVLDAEGISLGALTGDQVLALYPIEGE